jgi:hypothetical protein
LAGQGNFGFLADGALYKLGDWELDRSHDAGSVEASLRDVVNLNLKTEATVSVDEQVLQVFIVSIVKGTQIYESVEA